MNPRHLPSRIVWPTTEAVDLLYALGEEARILGISGYAVIPPCARKEKSTVFTFSSGDLEKILAVERDLVLGFSDMQADVARPDQGGRGGACVQPAQRRGHACDDRDGGPAS